MVIRGEITREKLQHIYKTIQRIIHDEDCYYTKEQIEELKKDSNNIFIEGGENIGENKRYWNAWNII